tara:strand:- start:593 stop:913 length:321 start_codon:yes stop_codon:yes gene_type:complete
MKKLLVILLLISSLSWSASSFDFKERCAQMNENLKKDYRQYFYVYRIFLRGFYTGSNWISALSKFGNEDSGFGYSDEELTNIWIDYCRKNPLDYSLNGLIKAYQNY